MATTSLKRKMETALLYVIEQAGLYAGTRLHSDEERQTTVTTSCAIAYYVPQGRSASQAMERGLLLLLVKSVGDTAEETDADPAPTSAELLHHERVQQIRQSVHVPGFAQVLTTASINTGNDLAVLQALVAVPPDPDPEHGIFQYAFAWETASVDSNCS